MAGGGGSAKPIKVAKTAPAITYEDEQVAQAGEATRRRLASGNSRDSTKAFWTALLTNNANNTNKKTLG